MSKDEASVYIPLAHENLAIVPGLQIFYSISGQAHKTRQISIPGEIHTQNNPYLGHPYLDGEIHTQNNPYLVRSILRIIHAWGWAGRSIPGGIHTWRDPYLGRSIPGKIFTWGDIPGKIHTDNIL